MMNIGDRIIKCKLNLADLADQLKTTPMELYKVVESDGKSNKQIYKELIKIINKAEKAGGK